MPFLTFNHKNMYSLFIGKAYAHGFLTLTKNVSILYQIDGQYKKAKQTGLLWNDPSLKIKWPKKPKVISLKDKQFKKL